MTRRALIALGGNLGDVTKTFDTAAALLRRPGETDVVRVGRVFRTAPMGDLAGSPFLNSAIVVVTRLDPLPLLDLLQNIETKLGRTRDVRWGPRTLDLDLIGLDDLVVDHPRLRLPHSGAWHRRFVLDPLAEIAADWMHPVWRLDVAALRRRLLVRPLPVVLSGGEPALRQALAERLSPRFPQARFVTVEGAPAPSRSSADNATAIDVVLGSSASGATPPGGPPRLCLTDFPEPPEDALRHALDAALGEPVPM